MDLEHLRTLVAVAETGTLTAAARARRLTQPAVSLQMKGLEENLGVELLHRGGRGVTLTRAGQAVLVHARQALASVRAAREEVGEILGLTRGTLRLGCTDAAATGILPDVFFHYHRRHPGIEVAVEILSTGELVDRLGDARLDLALGTLPVADPRVHATPILTETLQLFAPGSLRGHSLRRLLDEEPFIAFPRSSITRALVDRALDAGHLRPRVVMEVGRPTVMASLVESGLGISVLPEILGRRRSGLWAVAPRRLRIPRGLGLLVPAAREPEPAARAFVESVRALPVRPG